MGESRRSLMPAALAAIFTIVAAMAWALSREPPPFQVRRLPDGTQLKLIGITYGSTHRLIVGRNWQRLLLRLVPPNWQGHVGGDIYNLDRVTPPNTLVFWTALTAPLPERGWLRAVAFNERDEQCETQSYLSSCIPGEETVRCWVLPAFPRRGRIVGLRLYTVGPNRQEIPAAEFTVPNPAPGPYPAWKAERLPITRRDGDLDVTLTGFATRSEPEPFSQIRGRIRTTTNAAFRLARNGKPEKGWAAIGISLADATGNLIARESWSPENRNGLTSLDFSPGLLPNETAWRLRTEFTRTAGWDPAELWTVRGAQVPRRNSNTRIAATTARFGPRLRLELQLENYGEDPRSVFISVRAAPPLEGRWLCLLRATDERGPVDGLYGRYLCSLSSPDRWDDLQIGFTGEPGQSVFDPFTLKFAPQARSADSQPEAHGWSSLTVRAGARTLALTFALPKSHVLEFLARPHRR